MSLRERWRQWFFRRQAAATGPIELQRRQIYILPTRTGLLFAIVLLLMYLGAVNYNLGLGHALVFLLVGLGLVGMLHTFRNLVALRIRSVRARPVFAGETASFELVFENLRAEARPGIHLQKFGANAAFADHSEVEADLAPCSTTSVVLPVASKRRGWLTLDRLIVSTRYPLGLFRAWSYPWPAGRCLIYPAPKYLPLPLPRGNTDGNGGESVLADNQDDFAGFRRHQPGDSPRHIAWKIAARDTANAPLLVKEFTGRAQVQHWLDWDDTGAEIDVETRLSTLCGWVLQAQNADLDFGLRLPGLTLAPSHGEAHQAKALEALATFGLKQ